MADGPLAARPVSLVDLLDRVLAGGVVVAGEVTLCVADIELVQISLRLLLSSVSALTAGSPAAAARTDPEVQ
ncbi:gas vesicle protein [Actinocrinis sp.]|uniref:gas vesicle protein n=1 Tax=Actinocrinis sp. TaxID=1920516 RepID=UPI002BD1633E|nr:gas vesicle protein [Actinocrinis sp.]HXR69261.1 gas vesicle protein [Actinocrinis sp.]